MFASLLERLFKAPPPQNFSDALTLEKTGKPNEAMIVPVGAPSPSDAGKLDVLPGALYALTAQDLLTRCIEQLQSSSDCEITSQDSSDTKATMCVRTRLMRYPDLVYLHAMDVIGDAPRATLGAYSHSIYGRSDLGVNKKRLISLTDSLRTARID